MLRGAMRLSLQVRYAICGVFDLAYNGQGEPIQVRVISERQEVPVRYREQIFQKLRRADLVTSKRGPGGGYMLARPASAISLREVVEGVEGPLARLALGGAAAAATKTAFGPDFLWPDLAERFGRVLEETTLEALCRRAARQRIQKVDPEGPMYFI